MKETKKTGITTSAPVLAYHRRSGLRDSDHQIEDLGTRECGRGHIAWVIYSHDLVNRYRE